MSSCIFEGRHTWCVSKPVVRIAFRGIRGKPMSQVQYTTKALTDGGEGTPLAIICQVIFIAQ